MKTFVWATALGLALLFLAGATLTAIDAMSDPDFLTSPKTKIAAGWLVTGLMFLSLGVRGWKSHRRNLRGAKSNNTT